MKVTSQQIARWIDDYFNNCKYDVHGRKWEGKYIRGHAPYNNADDCYHRWLLWVEENKDMLSALPTFEDILAELKRNAIKGIGPLTLYDTATMLAFPDGKYPAKVYLHAGTAKGARAIGVTSKEADKQVFVNICPDFQKLSTAQIEDFLCVYAPYLLQDMDAIAKIKKRASTGCDGGGTSRGCHIPSL